MGRNPNPFSRAPLAKVDALPCPLSVFNPSESVLGLEEELPKHTKKQKQKKIGQYKRDERNSHSQQTS